MTDAARSKPILLTGAHRSGTTWLANMLALGGGTSIASEPFNLDGWAYRLDGLAENWFTYVPGIDQSRAHKAFEKVIARRAGRVYGRRQPQRYLPFLRGGRLIIKDPIACLSSEWLAGHFDLQVLVLVRHPAAFVASLMRMNWSFDFDHLLRQEQLMDDLLSPYRQAMERCSQDLVEQGALLWSVIYHVLALYGARHPEWRVVRHEDLSRAPIEQIRTLYAELGLAWNDSVGRQIEAYTGADNPSTLKEGVAHQMKRDSAKNIKRWKQVLDEEQVAVIRRATGSVAEQYYVEEDW